MPPSAMTVWALPSSDLQTRPTDTPAADASIAARSPAPPAPITRTSNSCVSNSVMKTSSHSLKEPNVVPDPLGAEPDVDVGEADAEKRYPGPQRVPFVEPGDRTPGLVAGADV